MKIKHIFMLFIIGFSFTAIGVLFKILHYQYGNSFLATGSLIKIISGILFVWKIVTMKKFKEFLNW